MSDDQAELETVARALLALTDLRKDTDNGEDAKPLFNKLSKDKALKTALAPLKKVLTNGAYADSLLHHALESPDATLRAAAALLVSSGRWTRRLYTRRGGSPRGNGKAMVVDIAPSSDRTRFFSTSVGGVASVRSFTDGTIIEDLPVKQVASVGDAPNGGVRIVTRSGDVFERRGDAGKMEVVYSIEDEEAARSGVLDGRWFCGSTTSERDGEPYPAVAVWDLDGRRRHDVDLGALRYVGDIVVSATAGAAAIRLGLTSQDEEGVAIVDFETFTPRTLPTEGEKIQAVRFAGDELHVQLGNACLWRRWDRASGSWKTSRFGEAGAAIFAAEADGVFLRDEHYGISFRNADDTESSVYGLYNGQRAFSNGQGRWVILTADDLVVVAPFDPAESAPSAVKGPAKGAPRDIAPLLSEIAKLHERTITVKEYERTETRPLTAAEIEALETTAKAPLPAHLRAFLTFTPGLLVSWELDNLTEDGELVEDFPVLLQGWNSAADVVEDTRAFFAQADELDFWPKDAVVVLSQAGDLIVGCRLEDSAVVSVDNHDGELTELGCDLGGFLELYRTKLEASLA